MKKLFLTSIIITVCVALYAAVWPQSAGDGKVLGGTAKPAVSAEIETNPEETPSIFFSADNNALEPKTVAESEPVKTKEILHEKRKEPASSAKLKSQLASAAARPSSNPKPGTQAIIDGKPNVWIPGFGWIEDHGGGSIGIPVDGKGDINKQIGTMGGSTVGTPGDELTGHKVGIMGGGTVAKDMYESGIKIGITDGQ